MVHNQGLPAEAPETNPGAAQEGSELQRSRQSPPHQGVSAGSPVPEETAEEGVSVGSPGPEDTEEEEVSAPAGPRDPSQQPSTATSVTSHSSTRSVEPVAFNRLCPQPSCEPPSAGVKRKRSARVRKAEGEEEEKSLFYMKVQAVNGVSVAWETGAGFEAIRKRPRIFKAKYSGGESFAGSDLSSSHTKSELGDVDQEAESSTGGPAEEAPQQPTGVPPEWLLTIKQGVRCLACCRVFSSLEALTQHVKQGLHEGFSCRVYYRVLRQIRARQRFQRRRVLGRWGKEPKPGPLKMGTARCCPGAVSQAAPGNHARVTDVRAGAAEGGRVSIPPGPGQHGHRKDVL
ncbi:protein FAM170B-like [Gopherus flavomarginatus]|uniref:protein FAM170B-like n=1 Tax=Gopherus flavomarginatus TaxID=286002 RepID=UPI0021CBB7A3|nr:protein FAM170B-like [Gopherus flavomarginatus]